MKTMRPNNAKRRQWREKCRDLLAHHIGTSVSFSATGAAASVATTTTATTDYSALSALPTDLSDVASSFVDSKFEATEALFLEHQRGRQQWMEMMEMQMQMQQQGQHLDQLPLGLWKQQQQDSGDGEVFVRGGAIPAGMSCGVSLAYMPFQKDVVVSIWQSPSVTQSLNLSASQPIQSDSIHQGSKYQAPTNISIQQPQFQAHSPATNSNPLLSAKATATATAPVTNQQDPSHLQLQLQLQLKLKLKQLPATAPSPALSPSSRSAWASPRSPPTQPSRGAPRSARSARSDDRTTLIFISRPRRQRGRDWGRDCWTCPVHRATRPLSGPPRCRRGCGRCSRRYGSRGWPLRRGRRRKVVAEVRIVSMIMTMTRGE